MKLNTKIIFITFALSLSLLMTGCALNSKDTTETTDSSLSNIKAKGTLIVGTSPPYGPMEFYDENGNIVGIDVDIAQEIASKLGVKLVVKDINFDTLDAALNQGEVDLFIASITISPERAETTLISDPYFNGGQIVVMRKNDKTITTITDLADKNVGIEDDGTLLKNELLKYVSNPVVKLYVESEGSPYITTAEADLMNGTIDAFVVDYIAAVSIVNTNPDLKILGTPFTQEFYGIAAKKGNNALITEVNKILRDMKQENTLKEIETKWLS